jgi:hypothetical protein
MKPGYFLIVSLLAFAACRDKASDNKYNASDSLGAKAIDTVGRHDTMYYERLQQKTGAGDSSSISMPRKDTAYYERLPQKTNPPDTSR